MTKRQQDFVCLIEQKQTKRIKQLMSRLFSDPEVALDFITALAAAGVRHPQGKVHETVMEFVEKSRQRFRNLPTDQFLAVLKIFYRNYGKNRFPFDICYLLGGTRIGEYKQAKQVIVQVLKIFRQYRIAADEQEMEYLSNGFNIFLGIIALTNLTHTWHNLIDASAQADREAHMLLKEAFDLFLSYGVEGFELVPHALWNARGDRNIALPPRAIAVVKIIPVTCLPVHHEHLPFVEQVLQEALNEAEKSNRELRALAEWFRHDFASFADLFKGMWAEVLNPSYGIRSDGKDQVQMGIRAFQNVGYQKLQLFREHMTFPAVRAKYWLKQGASYFSITTDLSNMELASYATNTDLPVDDIRNVVDQMLAYIALHCYCRIVTGKIASIPLPEKGRGQLKGTEKSSMHRQVRGGRVTLTVVRPFFRTLPTGYQPSEEALAGALAVLKTLPPLGKTFISEHIRGFQESEAVAPLFTYQGTDLGISL